MAGNTEGKITDEGIAKLRERVGQGFPGRRPWRTEATRDAIYHLALAIGDLSPLYLDEAYAQKTRWGTLIAPPIIVQTMDTLRAVGHSGLPEGLPGVHSIWTGSYYEWQRPVKLGDRIRADSYLKELREKESTFGGGRALYQTYEAKYYDGDGQYLGVRNDTWIRIERAKTRETKKYGAIELAQWKPADIERFMEEYRTQQRTVERYWDDVKVGDPLNRIIKGPLTPTAEIAFESYFGVYLVGNVVAANLYAKHPALMIPNEQGVPEPPQRVHWDNPFTQRLLGLPGAYDLGPERCSWLIQGMTDWIGDNGFLTKIEARYHKFNYMGDVTWVQGKVTDKFERDGKAMVRCAIECVNHRDEVTATATAEAELPHR
ncbi:MAG TPA: MaoC family dehydratase N-terminal domain-containing protein [Candidatus Acidoferrales bacterium]|nr:MaoC family dehydratase N-terminal domain-containing protein [Candidatus Acidoferrales bacterium]